MDETIALTKLLVEFIWSDHVFPVIVVQTVCEFGNNWLLQLSWLDIVDGISVVCCAINASVWLVTGEETVDLVFVVDKIGSQLLDE